MKTIGQVYYTLDDCIQALRQIIKQSEGYGLQPLEPIDVKLIYRDPINTIVADDKPSDTIIMIHVNICKLYSMEPDPEQSMPYKNKYAIELPDQTFVLG